MTTAVAGEWTASADLSDVMGSLDTSTDGLSSAQATARRKQFGTNSIRTHRVRAIAVLGRQFRNAVLWLLAGTAVVSFFRGDSTQAIIIGVILAAGIGVSFANEYRAERTAAALPSRVWHTTVVRRDGQVIQLDVNQLISGDVIRLTLGELVPADVRQIESTRMECNESILSGESIAREKSAYWNIAFIRRFMLPFAPISSFVRLHDVRFDARRAYLEPIPFAGQPHRSRGEKHRIHRRAARFSHAGRISTPAVRS